MDDGGFLLRRGCWEWMAVEVRGEASVRSVLSRAGESWRGGLSRVTRLCAMVEPGDDGWEMVIGGVVAVAHEAEMDGDAFGWLLVDCSDVKQESFEGAPEIFGVVVPTHIFVRELDGVCGRRYEIGFQ